MIQAFFFPFLPPSPPPSSLLSSCYPSFSFLLACFLFNHIILVTVFWHSLFKLESDCRNFRSPWLKNQMRTK